MHKMIDVKIKKSGVVTKVTQDYYDKYSQDGWLIEVLPEKTFPEPEMLIVETPKKATKPKVIPKE